MVLISEEGNISFVGGNVDGWALAQDILRPDHFILTEGGDKLATLRLELLGVHDMQLHLEATDGSRELWQRLADGESTPKAVIRRVPSRCMQRRFTKEGQAVKEGSQPVLSLPEDDSPATLESLAGRWMAVKDGHEEGMVIISDEGQVTFVGETDSENLRIFEDLGRPGHFAMREDGELLADMRFERGAEELLYVEGQVGGSEVWHRVGTSGEATPKNMRRVPARDLKRRWTKEGQARGPTLDDDDDKSGAMVTKLPTSEAGFALDVGLHELSGRWMASKDGVDQDMIIISEFGELSFVGDDDNDELQLRVMVDPSEPACFGMYQGTERLAGLRFQRPPRGPELLHVTGEKNDVQEVWRRLAAVPETSSPTPKEGGSPKSPAVVRRVPSRDIKRRWTKENQARTEEPMLPTIAGPNFGDEPMTVEGLAGRWRAVMDGHEEGMVLISSEGEVTFVGEISAADLKISADPRPACFVMSEDSEQMATLRLTRPPDGPEELEVVGQAGESETWYRVGGIADGTPKNVRRVPATGLVRRWTKEGQAAAEEAHTASTSSAAAPGTVVPVELTVLAGRWMAIRDGQEEGMVIISDDGGVSFVGDPDTTLQLRPGAKPGHFQMLEDDASVAVAQFERSPDGTEVLRVDDGLGVGEAWHRVAGAASPKASPVHASEPARQNMRRFTKQAQEARRSLEDSRSVRSAFEQSGAVGADGRIETRYFQDVLGRLNPALTPEAMEQMRLASGAGDHEDSVDLEAFFTWLFNNDP